MKRPFAALLLALSLTAPLCVPAAASQKTLKVHHSGLDDAARDPQGTIGRVFKTMVETPGNGELKVTILAGGVLGSNKDVLRLVQDGHIQAALLDIDAMVEVFPAMEALELPFALPDAPTAASILNGAFGQQLATDIQEATGLKVLGFGDSEGFIQLTAPRLDYAAPGNLAGQRLGVSQPVQARLVERLGATPVLLPAAELFAALQEGRIDGVAGSIEDLATAKVGEAQKYLIMADALFSPTVWIMNAAFWDGLDAEEQILVSRAARTALMAGRGVAHAVEASDKGIPALKQVMKPVPMPPEARTTLREAALPALREKLAPLAGGPQLLDGWLQAIEQNATSWPLPTAQTAPSADRKPAPKAVKEPSETPTETAGNPSAKPTDETPDTVPSKTTKSPISHDSLKKELNEAQR